VAVVSSGHDLIGGGAMGVKTPAGKAFAPIFYDRYLVPMSFRPYAQETARRIAGLPVRRLLETACGTGVVTYALVAALPEETEIVATDISDAMVEFAAGKQHTKVIWRQADAQNLPYRDGEFDTVVCQFGAMFFPDKQRAFREARRVLREHGSYVLTTWDKLEHNELQHVIVQQFEKLFPTDPPQTMRKVGFGYNDPQIVRADLHAAGFTKVDIEEVEKTILVASAADAATGFCQGASSRNDIEARDPNGLARVTDAVAKGLEERFGSGSFNVSARALYISAG
jgi:ubiquinone/menaquinone biosynthesis C-methylase UbiE